jgi:hydroxymethylpyrimidine/phosphomethylpyrimidine kinase
VFASGRGDEFAGDDMVAAIRELLVPQSTVVTPNIAELRRLAGDDDEDANLAECAQRLLDTGCEYVLVTGTHDSTPDVVNTLYHRAGCCAPDTWQRLPGSYHGSGCTLAARARRQPRARARDRRRGLRSAGLHLAGARARLPPGMGQHLPDRLFWARENGNDDDAS